MTGLCEHVDKQDDIFYFMLTLRSTEGLKRLSKRWPDTTAVLLKPLLE